MNYLGHVAVALAGGRDDPHFVLGAALPDLASMLGVRVDRAALPAAVADGVTCHLAADAGFHDHPAFRAGSAALRADLAAAGLATGPRRAVGHAGWELLLDGTLVGTDVEVAYRAALAEGAVTTAAVAAEHRVRWAALWAGGPPPPLRYDDPAWVAQRLVAVLGRRPRLAIPARQVPAVVEVLEHHLGAVRAVAAGVLADVAAGVAAGGVAPAEPGP